MKFNNGKPIVTIYTDGSLSGTSRFGGWSAVLISLNPTYAKEITGAEADTTVPRMELLAVIKALEELNRGCDIYLFSDSRYVISGIGLLPYWKNSGWKKKDGVEVANLDLWKRYDDLVNKFHHKVRANWVKGHANNYYNNRCDALAVHARKVFAGEASHDSK